jgi:hypothetical protein
MTVVPEKNNMEAYCIIGVCIIFPNLQHKYFSQEEAKIQKKILLFFILFHSGNFEKFPQNIY